MFTTVEVHGRLLLSDGQPAAGVPISATLSAAMLNSGQFFDTQPVTALTTATGDFVMGLPANTDPGTLPPDAHYTFVCEAIGLEEDAVVPASKGSVVLFDLFGSGGEGPAGPTGPEGPAGAGIVEQGVTAPYEEPEFLNGVEVLAPAVAEHNPILVSLEGTPGLVAVIERKPGEGFKVKASGITPNEARVNWFVGEE